MTWLITYNLSENSSFNCNCLYLIVKLLISSLVTEYQHHLFYYIWLIRIKINYFSASRKINIIIILSLLFMKLKLYKSTRLIPKFLKYLLIFIRVHKLKPSSKWLWREQKHEKTLINIKVIWNKFNIFY